MEYEQIVQHFKVIRRSKNSAQCICPAHADQKPSLTITKGPGKTLIYDHAGCKAAEIMEAVGLSLKDLYENDRQTWKEYIEKREGRQIEGIYTYYDIQTGKPAYTKLRLTGKVFRYGKLEDDRFYYGMNGKKRKEIPAVYGNIEQIRDADTVYYCEGEKDVENVNRRGLCGVTCGSSGDWTPVVKDLFAGKTVIILRDNDDQGAKLAAAVAKDLEGIATSVTTITPCTASKGADVSDFFANGGSAEELQEMAPEEVKPIRWVKFSEVEESAVEWLVPGYIPRKGITVLGSNGGVGKGTVSCSLIADISAGRETLLTRDSNAELPSGFEYRPGRVVWLNAEDPYREVLKPMLEANEANMDNILAMDEKQILESGICYSDEILKADIKSFHPDLVVFDPLQAFLPDKVKMAERNLMRREVGHAMALAKDCNCAVLIVMHTNKSRGSYGRNRLADSADMWDISRSVLMLGMDESESSLRYLSHEKSNFSPLQDSVNFTIGQSRTVIVKSRDQRRDRDHVLAAARVDNSDDHDRRTAKDRAKDLIIQILEDAETHEIETGDLRQELKELHGIGQNALEAAKAELKSEARIHYRPEGGGPRKGCKKYYICLSRI